MGIFSFFFDDLKLGICCFLFFSFLKKTRTHNWNSPNLFLGRILAEKSKKRPSHQLKIKTRCWKHVKRFRTALTWQMDEMSPLNWIFFYEHVKFVVRPFIWYFLWWRLNDDWWARESLVALKACTYSERPFLYGKHSKKFLKMFLDYYFIKMTAW
jgi:hypothetical protein